MQIHGYSTRRYDAQESHLAASRSVRSGPRSRMPHSRRPERQSVLRRQFHRGQFDRRNPARNQLREANIESRKVARCHQSHVQSHLRAQEVVLCPPVAFISGSYVHFRIPCCHALAASSCLPHRRCPTLFAASSLSYPRCTILLQLVISIPITLLALINRLCRCSYVLTSGRVALKNHRGGCRTLYPLANFCR